MRRRHPRRSELLDLDVDIRLLPLWARIWADETIDDEQIAPLIHDAYARGYYHALTEPEYAQLYKEHRWPVPVRERQRNE